MKKVEILNTNGIYFGDEGFNVGDIVDVISLNHDGECQVLEVLSTKTNRPFRIYEGEFDCIKFIR